MADSIGLPATVLMMGQRAWPGRPGQGPARPAAAAGILCGVQSDAIRSLGDIEDRHWWFAERSSLIRAQIDGVRPDGWALDVGAAAGGNTRVLVDAGWDCVALEYSRDWAPTWPAGEA